MFYWNLTRVWLEMSKLLILKPLIKKQTIWNYSSLERNFEQATCFNLIYYFFHHLILPARFFTVFSYNFLQSHWNLIFISLPFFWKYSKNLSLLVSSYCVHFGMMLKNNFIRWNYDSWSSIKMAFQCFLLNFYNYYC